MLTSSNPFTKGTKAPDFKLPDTISDQVLSLQNCKGENGTVIFFICNHCPFVIHINEELVRLANDYKSKGIGFIAISSNDVDFVPQDGPGQMKQHAKEVGYPFPYLYDESQSIAKAYDATCTPDFYVFDKELLSVYHGRLDDSRPSTDISVTGKDIRSVLDCILENKEYEGEELPSMGCNIKWK